METNIAKKTRSTLYQRGDPWAMGPAYFEAPRSFGAGGPAWTGWTLDGASVSVVLGHNKAALGSVSMTVLGAGMGATRTGSGGWHGCTGEC